MKRSSCSFSGIVHVTVSGTLTIEGVCGVQERAQHLALRVERGGTCLQGGRPSKGAVLRGA